MSVTTFLINEERYADFDAFLARHPKGHVLQTRAWGEVKRPTGWRPLHLLTERDGEIVGAVTLLCRRLPARLGSIFYSPRGPVLNIADQEALDSLCKRVKELAREHKAVFWKADPDIPDGDKLWEEHFCRVGFRPVDGGEGFEGVQPRHVFRLDISPDLETLLANCHQKTRYNIRLAEKRGVEIHGNQPKSELKAFYDILTTTASRDNFLIRPYSYFEGFYDKLVPEGLAELFMAYYEGEPIAGTLAFRLGEKAWYIYGASSNAHRNVMPNYLIQWKMIEWAHAHGCTMYDFRGVPGDVGEEHPLYGLVKFKRGFGGDYTSFMGEYDLVYSPFKYKLYTKVVPIYQEWVRKRIHKKKERQGETND